jgi:hypothetical protein
MKYLLRVLTTCLVKRVSVLIKWVSGMRKMCRRKVLKWDGGGFGGITHMFVFRSGWGGGYQKDGVCDSAFLTQCFQTSRTIQKTGIVEYIIKANEI